MADVWGVAVSQPQRHRLATEQLRASSVEYFLPMRENVTVSRGRHHRLLVPYFGRYIFIAVCEAWEKILDLRGVAGILLNPETLRPWQVDRSELEAVRAMCNERGIVKETVAVQTCGLRYGDSVYVDHGPLANIRGSYDGKIGRHREAALFVMFGREQRVIFEVGELRAAQGL